MLPGQVVVAAAAAGLAVGQILPTGQDPALQVAALTACPQCTAAAAVAGWPSLLLALLVAAMPPSSQLVALRWQGPEKDSCFADLLVVGDQEVQHQILAAAAALTGHH